MEEARRHTMQEGGKVEENRRTLKELRSRCSIKRSHTFEDRSHTEEGRSHTAQKRNHAVEKQPYGGEGFASCLNSSCASTTYPALLVHLLPSPYPFSYPSLLYARSASQPCQLSLLSQRSQLS